MVLAVGLVLISVPEAEIHDFCDAATVTITATGEILDEVPEYDLAIDSTVGGSVSTPGEGNFAYDEGVMVNLEVTPDTGYRFVRWTGDVDTIDDADAAATTITMEGDYTITANFEEIPSPPVNWVLIGGIIAAVVAAGLVVFFMRRRKAAETKRY